MPAKLIACPQPIEGHRGFAVNRTALLSIVAAALAAVTGYVLGWGQPLIAGSDRATILATLAQVASTMLGFMLAALAIVASINHTHLVRMMRKSGHYESLLATLFVGSAAFFVCAIACFAVLLGFPSGRAVAAALIGLHVAAVAALLDTGRKFWLVLTNLRD